MSTKAQIQSSINTINDGGANTAAEVRAVYNTILDNIYGTVITEAYSNLADNTTFTTPNGTTHYYGLEMVKQGRVVTVTGFLTNKTGGITANEVWFNIDPSEYTHDTNTVNFYGVSLGSGNNVECRLTTNEFKIIGVLGNNDTVYVNFSYFTQD